MAPRRVSGGGGGIAGERCHHLRGGNGGCWVINAWPARRLRGACRLSGGAFPGSRTKPTIYGCGGSAAHGGGYLATPPSPSSSLAATCAIFYFPFDTNGCSCSHPASVEQPCGFLASRSCSCSHLMPSQACGLLGQTKPPAGGPAGQWS